MAGGFVWRDGRFRRAQYKVLAGRSVVSAALAAVDAAALLVGEPGEVIGITGSSTVLPDPPGPPVKEWIVYLLLRF